MNEWFLLLQAAGDEAAKGEGGDFILVFVIGFILLILFGTKGANAERQIRNIERRQGKRK